MQVNKQKTLEDMRKLMAERKKKDLKPTKIDNPLAKYNSAGQLMCVLCSSIVRSENVWQVHINSKQHRTNVEQAKKLKEMTNNFTEGKIKPKRPAMPSKDVPAEKKPKSILKNPKDVIPMVQPIVMPVTKSDVPTVVTFHTEEIVRRPLNKALLTSTKKDEISATLEENISSSSNRKQEEKVEPEHPLPEGFFDDPILDAKVRNIEYKDPVEEEWEKFQKEIKEEATASAEIIAEEQEEATAERQIDEIDEQIRNWSRVLDLELRKEETKKKKQESEQMDDEDDEDSSNEADIDEFLDWRAKKSFS